MSTLILGIESSCDDTAAAIIDDGYLLSSRIANQDIHERYGGVVPELASRAHQQNIIPVVDAVLTESGRSKEQLDAIAFTRGPGLLGPLLVGTSFAKGLALALQKPLIEVNHLQAHILAHFILENEITKSLPSFPFLCLLVSGGHTQLVIVHSHLDMQVIGRAIDDAAGEAFDKCAKLLGLPYPGGPLIDEYARLGNDNAFVFPLPVVEGLDYSFSGLKTSFLYFLRDRSQVENNFIKSHLYDICASIQKAIVDVLIQKLVKAAAIHNVTDIAIAGGVAANSGLRHRILKEADKYSWNTYFPEPRFSTDNAAMIAITGYYKYKAGLFTDYKVQPLARSTLDNS